MYSENRSSIITCNSLESKLAHFWKHPVASHIVVSNVMRSQDFQEHHRVIAHCVCITFCVQNSCHVFHVPEICYVGSCLYFLRFFIFCIMFPCCCLCLFAWSFSKEEREIGHRVGGWMGGWEDGRIFEELGERKP